jgi:uncharacterized protein (DUF58 family)
MHASRSPELSAGANFVDPKVLARIQDLELLARTVVEGFINGLHRSPHLGMSMDFAEHRAYMPGDDIRRIDWRLYGRADRFFVKEFEADTNTDFSVVLDVSRSMGFGGGAGGLSKLDYARYLAACLTYFSHRQRDRVGFVAFDADIVDYVPPSAKHLPVVLHAIDRIGTRERGVAALGASGGKSLLAEGSSRGAGTDPAARHGHASPFDRPLRKIAEATRRRSMLVLVSDLYEEPQRVLQALNALRGKGNDLIVMHVLDPAEVDFPFDAAANFQDLESGTALPIVPAYVRDQYRALVAAHIASLSRLLGEHRIDYALFNTAQPLDHALFSYLATRQRASRVR